MESECCQMVLQGVYTNDCGEVRTGAVAELADALDLGSSSFGSAGSIPVSPTIFEMKRLASIGRRSFFCLRPGK